MNDGLEIRDSHVSDRRELEDLYSAAFPDEDLIPLLRALLEEDKDVFSYVAVHRNKIVGHIIFTLCDDTDSSKKVALLGPLSVHPAMQRQGIGSALVNAGLQRISAKGVVQVVVLGDPAYYSRFGFSHGHDVQPPYKLPDGWASAWQSVLLSGVSEGLRGKLVVPGPWARPELWQP